MFDMKKYREMAGLLEGKSDPDRFRSARGARREQILGMTGLGRKPKVDLSDTRSPFDSIMDGYSQMYGSNEEIAERLRGANKEDLKEILGGLGMSEAQYKEGLDIDNFAKKLAQRESGGDSEAVNKEGYTGLLQFGPDRIADYNKANKTKITMEQFRYDKDLQMKVGRWHIKDLDRAYDKNKKAQEKLSRDAFRAVAHLGGINGAYKYVKTIDLPIGDPNKYNPEDSNGTMLSDYHQLGDSFIQGSDT